MVKFEIVYMHKDNLVGDDLEYMKMYSGICSYVFTSVFFLLEQ